MRIPGFVDATATLIAGPFAWRKRSPFVQGASHVRLAPETFTSYPAPTGEVAVGMLLSRNDTNYHRQIPMITGLSARLSEAFGKFTTGVATRRRGLGMPGITHIIPGYPTGRAVFPGDVPAVLSFPGIVVRPVSGNPRPRLGICQFTVRFLVFPSETPPAGNSRHLGPRRPSRHRNPQQAVGEPCSAAPVDWFSAVRISIADFLADASFSPLCSRSEASGTAGPSRKRGTG